MARTPLRTLRVADDEWAAWTKAAEKTGLSVSAWLREAASDRLLIGSPPITTKRTRGGNPSGGKKATDLKPPPAGPAPGASVCPPHPKAARTVLNGGLVRCGACGDLVK